MGTPFQCEDSNCSVSFMKNVVNTLIVSADQVGVIPWCIFWWFVWYNFRWAYERLFTNVFRRTTIEEQQYKLLIELYWKIAFASLSIPFALANLNLEYIDVSDRFSYVLESHIAKWLKSGFSLQTKMSYVILSGYYLNNISEVCCKFGLYSKQFALHELFGFFFIATYPLKCIKFGLAVTTLINIVECFLILTDIFVCLGYIARSLSLRVIVSHVFFIIHLVLWFLVYFFILPVYFVRALFNKMDLTSDVRHLLMHFLLSCAFVAYYTLYIVTCPFTRLVYSFVQTGNISFIRTLGLSDDNHDAAQTAFEEKEKERIAHRMENLKMIYQTVKCAMRMKRKLAQIRLAKLTERKDCTSENSSSMSEQDEIITSHISEEDFTEEESKDSVAGSKKCCLVQE